MVVLRFEGEILVFPTSSQEAAYMLHELLVALADIGLFLDGSKTKVLTTQAQPPNKITTPCMLTACGSEPKKNLGLQYHLQQAAKAYHANKLILVVSSVACFAHRTIYQEHLQTLDIHFRKIIPIHCWPSAVHDWKTAAMNRKGWYKYIPDFCSFMFQLLHLPTASFSKVEAVAIIFRPWKCLCPTGVAKVNAPVLGKFHSLIKFDMLSAVFDSLLISHHASRY